MKKIAIMVLGLTVLGASIPVLSAETQTLSFGYAQSKLQDFKNIRGINIKYRYEWDNSIGVITSLSYLSGKQNTLERDFGGVSHIKEEVKHYSLLVGPAYRLNEYVSVYAMGGLTKSKANSVQVYKSAGISSVDTKNVNEQNFAYSAGFQINPIDSIAIDIAYEGTKIHEAKMNGFNIGIGYSF